MVLSSVLNVYAILSKLMKSTIHYASKVSARIRTFLIARHPSRRQYVYALTL